MRKIWWVIAAMAGGITGALAFQVYLRYLADLRAGYRRIQVGCQIAETAYGLVEYYDPGQGFPVLVAHGAGGGWDQGLVIARHLEDCFRWIAVSRFGYLGSPLPTDASPAAQADAYAALLDTLKIPRVVVMGISAGGPSVLQFALRYPERCSGVVLYSALTGAEKTGPDKPVKQPKINRAMFNSDFFIWLAITFGWKALSNQIAVNERQLSTLGLVDKLWLRQALRTLFPLTPRKTGLENDMVLAHLVPLPLDQISRPVLIVHARDDRLVPFSTAEACSRLIPGAQLVALETGGHLLAGQRAQLQVVINSFMENCQRIHTGVLPSAESLTDPMVRILRFRHE